MGRSAWDDAVNAEFVADVKKIVAAWQNGELDDNEAIEKIEYRVEDLG